MAAGDVYQPAVLVDRARFFIREIGFKTYPCCRWLHGMLDAGAAVRDDRAFGVHEIARVRVEAARTIAATFGDPRPGSMVDAQFSAPHALAMLLREIPYQQWWRAEHRAEAATHALADRVELVEDPALTERFHALGRDSNRIPARVRVTLTDGWSGEAYNEEASGAAGRRPAEGGAGPDDARLAAKRADLLATRLSPDRCAALTHAVARLAEAPDVAALSSLLEATSPG